jgi:hypothetical protein
MEPQDSKPDTDLERALIDLAVEGWRFARVFARVLSKLDAGEGARYVGQHRYYLKQLEHGLAQLGMRFVDVEGSTYDPGVAATAINLADFEPNAPLLVDQMIEPIIMGPDGLIRPGTVMVRKAEL